MRTSWILGAAVAAFLMACGNTGNEGRVAMEVGVSGLTAEQNFCFTWQLYQLNSEGEWYLVDEMADELCAAQGVDTKSAFGTCYGDQRFMIAYRVTFKDGDAVLGTATGTSGGAERDVCVKNFDTASDALFQFGNQGNVGGVNPGLAVDQVCANDKVQIEDGRGVSALWLQGDECNSALPPDSFCALGTGYDFRTTRVGVTEDGKVRYIFNETSGSTSAYAYLYFVAFEPTVPANTLVLNHNPWALGHELYDGYYAGRWDMPEMAVSYRFDTADAIKVGFLYYYEDWDYGILVHDNSGDCNGPVSLDSWYESVYPGCTGASTLLGAVPNGGSAFSFVFACDGGGLSFTTCDAQSGDYICDFATAATRAAEVIDHLPH